MSKKISAFEVKQWVLAQDLSTARMEKLASESSVSVLMKCGDYMRGFHDGAFHALCSTPKIESPENSAACKPEQHTKFTIFDFYKQWKSETTLPLNRYQGVRLFIKWLKNNKHL